MKFKKENNKIKLSLPKNIQHGLEELGLTNCKNLVTPMTSNLKLVNTLDKDHARFKKLKINYRSVIGLLNHIAQLARPNISFAVSHLSQFLKKPCIIHWEAFTHVLRYLCGTAGYALVYQRRTSSSLCGYTNADWGNCLLSCCLVTGFLTLQNNHLIGWRTKKQPAVSLLSCKAKYRCLADYTSEVLWLRQLRLEIGISSDSLATVVHKDNQGCIAVANSNANSNSQCMKHVDIELHFVRDAIKKGEFVLCYTATSKMLANFLTKSAPRPALAQSLNSVGLLKLEERGGFEIGVTDGFTNSSSSLAKDKPILCAQ